MDVELVARLRGVIGRLARQLNDTSTGEGLTPPSTRCWAWCVAAARWGWPSWPGSRA